MCPASAPLPFLKMNGTGNAFVVLDLRALTRSDAAAAFAALTPAAIRALAARTHPKTKGFDQLIVLEPGGKQADCFMHIFNADGGEVSACGNATRCVGHLLLSETGAPSVRIGTKVDVLTAERGGGVQHVVVNMGAPRLAHEGIPLARGVDRSNLPLAHGPLSGGVAVGMGNPHVVFFVEDVNEADVLTHGPEIEHRTDVFPERVNVNIAAARLRHEALHTEDCAGDACQPPVGSIELRTWERGAGATLACGTGACATLVAAAERGLTGRKAYVHMPGGTLLIDWRDDGNVWMSGPVELEFSGEIALAE